MSLFESLLINQLSLLQEQSKNYHEWFKQDQSRVDQFLVQDCFAGGVVSDLWEGALARLYDNNIEIKGRWNSFSGVCADEGLHVSNRIIRCKETYSLKSLALEVKIDLKLLVNSQVWVVTRGQDVKDPAACILKISKESELLLFLDLQSELIMNSYFLNGNKYLRRKLTLVRNSLTLI